MNEAIESNRILQIKQTEKIKELKQTEDYFYKQIQETMAELEHIKANKDKVTLDEAHQNYQKAMFLEPGENGEMSQKEQLEQELITL